MKTALSILIFLIGLSACSQSKPTEVGYFANNGFGNSITGKAGEYYKGVTYVAYQGPLEDPYVAAFNHETGKWAGPYKAGISLMGKAPGKKIDNHGKPTLVVDSQGYIHLVFGGHGGTKDLGENPLGNYHNGKQIHVISKNPEDISSWEVVDNVSPFGTYSQFLKMDNGDIYLFFRHGAHRSNWVYQVSKDDCKTFTPPASIVLTKQTKGTEENPIIMDSWYLSFNHGRGNDIIVAYNYHVCKGPHHDGERHNCYYMKFDTDNDQWLNVKGEKLQLPITKEYADHMTLVKNTGDRWTHNGVAALDNQGNPHVTSYEGDHEGKIHGGVKDLMHYYWTGSDWAGGKTDLASGAEGEIRISEPLEINFILATDGEVGRWSSSDGGKRFTKGEILLAQKIGGISLSHMVRNAHPDAQIIAAEKIKGSDYVRMYLLGENGAIKRLKVEADVKQ